MVSEMNYDVSSGTLNHTIPYLKPIFGFLLLAVNWFFCD